MRVERIVAGQVHGEGFKSPTRGHHIAKPRHRIGLGERRVESFKSNDGAPKNDLGNDQQWDDDVNDLRRFERRRNHQAKDVAKQGNHEQHKRVGQEELRHVQNGVGHSDKSDGMHQRDQGHHGHFGVDVVAPLHVQESLALQQTAVPKDFLCTDGQAEEEGDDD